MNEVNCKHCWHTGTVPWTGVSNMTTFPEICCNCSPKWMRLTISVPKITFDHESYMIAHPIYHFEETSVRILHRV